MPSACALKSRARCAQQSWRRCERQMAYRPTSGLRSRSPWCRRAAAWRGPHGGPRRRAGRRDARRRCPTARGAHQRSASRSRPCARPGCARSRSSRSSHGSLERVGDAGEDRVDRAAADPRPEQLLAQLDDVAARDAVAHRQRRDRCLQARTKRAPGDLRRKLCPPRGARTRGSAPAGSDARSA